MKRDYYTPLIEAVRKAREQAVTDRNTTATVGTGSTPPESGEKHLAPVHSISGKVSSFDREAISS